MFAALIFDMKKTLLLLFILLGIQLNAQESIHLSKEQFLDSVLLNNTKLKIAIQQTRAAHASYQQSAAVLLPDLSVSQNALITNNPLMSFGFKLNQASVGAADFNPDLLNNPSDTRDYFTQLSIKQPLINPDLWEFRKAARSKYEATQFNEKRTKQYIELLVDQLYMQLLLSYEAVSVLEKAQASVLAYQAVAIKQFDLGYMTKADQLSINVRVLEVENQLSLAKSQQKKVSNYLHLMMNSKQHLLIKPIDQLELTADNTTDEYSQNRSDLLAVSKKTEAFKHLYSASKLSFIPKLNAFGTLELHSDTMLESTSNSFLAGVQLKWNLFKGGSKIGAIKEAKANYVKAQLEEEHYLNETEHLFDQAKLNLSNAEQSLASAQLAVAQLQESLRIRENRYKEGLEATTDLLNTEAQLAEKMLYQAQAIYNYNYSVAYLKFLTQE